MLNGDDNNNLNFLHPVYTKWLMAYMNVGFIIYFIILFPLSLIVSLGITLLMIVLLTAYIFYKKIQTL